MKKKAYYAPNISVHTFVCEQHLMTGSLKIGGDVDNSSDIGFVKGSTDSEDGEFWDFDWQDE